MINEKHHELAAVLISLMVNSNVKPSEMADYFLFLAHQVAQFETLDDLMVEVERAYRRDLH
jgi:hypothetical protein